MPNLGPTELIIILVIILVIFGPKKLPGLGKSLGTGMREFKDSVTGKDAPDSLEARRDDAPSVPGAVPGAEPTKAESKPASPPSDAD